jgi:hypothetical protein
MVLIDLIVNGQTCVAQNNFAQHDCSCMGRIRNKVEACYLGYMSVRAPTEVLYDCICTCRPTDIIKLKETVAK